MEIDFTLRADPTAAYRSLGAGSSTAVLFLHGLTGSPVSWVPIARAIAAEGIVVNPALYVDSPFASLLPVLRHVVRTIPSIGGDIAHPDRDEYAYDRTPVAPLATFHRALSFVRDDLWKVDCPVTAMVSGEDNVVGPRTLRALRSNLPHPPRIVALRQSRHVATLDFDANTIAEAVLQAARPEAAVHSPSETRE